MVKKSEQFLPGFIISFNNLLEGFHLPFDPFVVFSPVAC